MGSFKLRLLTYFLLLSLVPLLAASWAFSEVATRSEVGNADARLNAALRVAVRDYSQTVYEDASAPASSLANATSVQRAFVQHNRAALMKVAHDVPNSAFYSPDQLVAGSKPPPLAAIRTARVVSTSGVLLGRILVWVPLDIALLRELRANAGLERSDLLLLATHGQIVAGPRGLVGSREIPGERPRLVHLAGTQYRPVSTAIPTAHPAV